MHFQLKTLIGFIFLTFKEELIIKKMLRHSDEILGAFLLQIAASHTSVKYNTHPLPPLHSKFFLQVLSRVLYC